jgi:hypothetical protein
MAVPVARPVAAPAAAEPTTDKVDRIGGTMRPRSQDILDQMGSSMYRRAYERGMSLSAYLERIDPSEQYKDGLDGFGRLMKVAGIVTRSNPGLGYYADSFSEFEKTPQTMALVHEWARRQWKRAATGKDPSTRSVFLSTEDNALNSWMRQYQDAATPRFRAVAPAIPLDELVAITTPIEGDAYRAFYLQDETEAERLVRVAQGAEIPRAKLVGGDQTIRLHKYGRALEVSYETLRRQRIDMVAFHIARMAVQAEADKVSSALDVLINGDGNANAAQVFDLTDLDPDATAGTLSLAGWLAFKLKFMNPYAITTALVQEGTALQMMLLNTGSANIPLIAIQNASGFGSFRPINPGLADAVGLGWTADAPASKVVAFDNRFALERVVEVGAEISEVDRWITRQVQVLTITEVEGYAVLDAHAAKVLDIAA